MNEPPWYHSIWLTPLLITVFALQWITSTLTAAYHRVRMRYILWRYPELKDLQKLAGNSKR